jgi:long-chain acyl-CoA synthetase
MASALDLRIDAVTSQLTGPGGQLETTSYNAFGVDLPIIKAAPPNLALYFAYFCNEHKDKEFLVAGDERLTFAQVYAAAHRFAGALIDGFGVKKGDRIGIAMRNAPSWVVVYMGVLMSGGTAVLLNGWWQGQELAAGIDDVGTSLVFADPQRAARLNEVGYSGAAVVTLDIGQALDQALAPVFNKTPATPSALPEIGGDDIATILFTSGSTGQSKGAYHTHRSVVQGTFTYILQTMITFVVATEAGLVGPNPSQPCALVSVPLFHVTGEVPVMLVSFALGRRIILLPKWDAVHAMQLIEREKVTNFTGVPLMSFELATHPDRKKYDLSSLQTMAAGGAPRPLEHVKRLNLEFPNSPPALGYGLTETNAVGAGNFMSNYQDKPNSTGRATSPMVEIAILDDAGQKMPQGERGEVCIRSSANFSGYWGREDATKAAITADGFFRSGDIGYLDDAGYLFIVDRKKDIIIRGGENISCQEVEAALYEHEAVAESCVFGLPEERLGEVVGAVVHLHPGHDASADEILASVRESIAAFKVPHRLWIEDKPLPRLGTEKVDKVGLRAHYQAVWKTENAH